MVLPAWQPPSAFDTLVVDMQDADAQGIAALRSILNLEREQGYRDTAVMGGMDRFLEQWASRLAPVIGSPPKYSSLSREQREQWAVHVLSRLPAVEQRRRPRRATQSSRRASRPPQLKLSDDVARVRGVTSSNLPKLRRLELDDRAGPSPPLPHPPQRLRGHPPASLSSNLAWSRPSLQRSPRCPRARSAPSARRRTPSSRTRPAESGPRGSIRATWSTPYGREPRSSSAAR